MYLQNVAVNSREDLSRYFTIRELYDENIQSTLKFKSYKKFCAGLAPLTAVDVHLHSCLVPGNKGGEYVFADAPAWFHGNRVDAGGLIDALRPFAGPLSFPAFVNNAENTRRIRDLAATVSFEEEATLLFLFLLLHIQARRTVEESSLSYMKKKLEACRRSCLPRRESVTSAPDVFEQTYGLCAPGSRLLQTLHCGGLMLCVQLEGTAMKRTLFYEESLMVLHAGGHVPLFLPRGRQWEGDSADRYARSLIQTLESLPHADDDPPILPILSGGDCALYLTRSGRAIADGQEIARDVLAAAADESFFYFAFADGVAYMPRNGGAMTRLADSSSPVEEIDVQDGMLLWRTADTSQPHTMPAPRGAQEE